MVLILRRCPDSCPPKVLHVKHVIQGNPTFHSPDRLIMEGGWRLEWIESEARKTGSGSLIVLFYCGILLEAISQWWPKLVFCIMNWKIKLQNYCYTSQGRQIKSRIYVKPEIGITALSIIPSDSFCLTHGHSVGMCLTNANSQNESCHALFDTS